MKLTASHGVLGLLMIALLGIIWNMFGAPFVQSSQGSLSWLSWWMLPVAIVLGYGGWAARKDEPVWSKRFFYWGAGALLFVSLLIIAFGKDEVLKSNQQGLFDGPRPNAMGWTNIHGEFIIKHGLTPEKCVPAGYDAFDADGNIFPFHQTTDRGHKDCYENGIALVPNSHDTTPDVSGFTPQGIMGWITTTPAEKAAEEAAEQAAIDAEQKRRLELLQAQNPAPDPTLIPVKLIVPDCDTSKWATVDIPSKRNIHLPWNTAAASYEWRDSASGNWIKQSDRQSGQSYDKVRMCAKHKSYADDIMIVTWSIM